MAYANEQSYEEMIRVLQTFSAKMWELCSVLAETGLACVEVTDSDPAAMKNSEKLQKCVGNIRGALEGIREITAILDQELDDIGTITAKLITGN